MIAETQGRKGRREREASKASQDCRDLLAQRAIVETQAHKV